MDHPFSHFETETITIIGKNHSRSAVQKAQFSSNQFILFNPTLTVKEGAVVERPTYNSNVEQWDVVHVEYTQAFYEIPAKLTLSVEKRGSLLSKEPLQNQTINFHGNAQGVIIGNQNTQNLDISLRDLIGRIDNGSGTLAEKNEAKGLLAKALAHPLTAAIVGALLA